jgi:undecaprenyl phosphate N,N'-diacetylbacillosamine 1-phosphate transferase
MYPVFIKRFLDIALSIMTLPFLIVFFIPVALIIKIEDGGSIFYNDFRLGRYGKTFKMLKFRSMKMNAPDIRNYDGSTFNSEHDSRLTRVGRILRKTSVDELPQIINVLMGDMSLVGPRPNMADSPVETLDAVRLKRITVRPGITGYSQAYFRNSITQDEKFANDCYYVDRLSFLLDLKIICRTVLSIIKRDKIFTKTHQQQGNE